MNRRHRAPRLPAGLAGFTLTEFALALAVTGLVGALGVSAYRTYVVRAQVAHAVELSGPIRTRVATAFDTLGVPPRDSAEAGLSPATLGPLRQYVESVAIIDGRIELRFGSGADAAIGGQSLSLTPFETVTREVVWICGNQLPGAGLEPLGFAGGVRQPLQTLTTIDGRYLPSSCR